MIRTSYLSSANPKILPGNHLWSNVPTITAVAQADNPRLINRVQKRSVNTYCTNIIPSQPFTVVEMFDHLSLYTPIHATRTQTQLSLFHMSFHCSIGGGNAGPSTLCYVTTTCADMSQENYLRTLYAVSPTGSCPIELFSLPQNNAELHMGGCQNYGLFWIPLMIRHLIFRVPKKGA